MRLRAVSTLVLLPLLSASAVTVTNTLAPPLAAAAVVGPVDGPDVSSFQHPNGAAISWPAVRKSGREFAIVKATEGTSYVNPWFARDYAGVKAAALVRGSYHYAHPSRPIAATALAQAKYYVARLGAVTAVKTLPPALDLEDTGGLSRAELVVWAQSFLLDVRHLTGRTPMIYSYPYFWAHEVGDAPALARYPLWMATYSGTVDPTAALWQFTASGSVSGIRGGVDVSRLTTGTDWPTMSDGTLPSPWPATVPGVTQRVVPHAAVRSASITWMPPDAGTSALTGYDVGVLETGQHVFVGSTTTHAAFAGLVTGRTYTLTVTPRNAYGSGPTSARSVVPVSPTSLVTTASSGSIYVGSSVHYVGTLTNRDTGAPLAGAEVQVFDRRLGYTTWSLVGRVATDSAGQVRLSLAPHGSMQLRMYYQGSPAVQSAATLTTTLVRTRIAARLSHPVALVRIPVVLYGSISPRFAGVVVVRQVWSAGAWRTVARTVTGGAGSYAFRVTAGGRSTTYMRTVVAGNHGRAPGYSNVVKMTFV